MALGMSAKPFSLSSAVITTTYRGGFTMRNEVRAMTKVAAFRWRFGMTEAQYYAYQAPECDPHMGEEERARRKEVENETLSQYCVARAQESAAEYRTRRTREAIALAKEIAAEEKRKATEETRRRIEKARALPVPPKPTKVKRKAVEAAWISRAKAQLETESGLIRRIL
jgi:hypothetical protein